MLGYFARTEFDKHKRVLNKKSYFRGLRNHALRRDVDYWISHEHRLIFLGIPKNATSFLTALFFMNHPLARDFDPVKETAVEYHRRGGTRGIALRNTRVLQHTKYTKFVALRDPMARAVSAYLDKIVKKVARGRKDRPGRYFYDQVSRVTGRRVDEQTMTYEDFVDYICAVPDFRRDKHYKTQAYFVRNNPFDFYGDISHMDEILQFLQTRGFHVGAVKTKSPKRTAYARPQCHPIKHPARAGIGELVAHAAYPAVTDFFDYSLLQRFLEAYKHDLDLFCRARNLDPVDVVAPYAGGV